MQNKILFFFFFMHQSYSLNHIGKAKQEYIQSVMCCLLFSINIFCKEITLKLNETVRGIFYQSYIEGISEGLL